MDTFTHFRYKIVYFTAKLSCGKQVNVFYRGGSESNEQNIRYSLLALLRTLLAMVTVN